MTRTAQKISKAMLLSAGLGTRLRPLTFTTPKPLLPLGGRTIIDHQLEYLSKNGISDIAVNLHHLGSKIRGHVGDGRRYGVKIAYFEEEVILGTGGGVKNAGSFFAAEPFFVLNSDAVLDAKLADVASCHLASKAHSTMVLKKRPDGVDFTPVKVEDGRVTSFGSGDHFFTGLQIVDSKMLDTLPPKGEVACLVEDGYRKMLSAGVAINAYVYDGPFIDIGTLERYETAKKMKL